MKELLVPVGNMNTLKIAIFSGADAVYLGGKKFGARAYAGNFSDEEMIEAIKICHLYGVRIYVTVNTLIHEGEMDEVLEYVKFLHKNNVDAIIVQDIGLISLVREVLPNLDIHVSTQAHTANEYAVKFFEKMGVKRIVLAREMSIDAINSIDTSLEIETFIHGALCISYSGQCLFSQQLMNRSGNRGECAQICRLPFKIKNDDTIVDTPGSYLLSTKELNTSSSFKEIMESNIYSLKIEGRMKSPEYVGCVTRLYRDLIDKYYRGEEVSVNEEYLNDLKVIFNREYTRGFLFNSTNQELMNIKTCNHLGVRVGKVIAIDKKYITIEMEKPIAQGDGIRFMNSKEGMMINFLFNDKNLLIKEKDKGVIKVLNKCQAIIGETVNKTFDVNIAAKYRDSKKKRISITMVFEAFINREAKLTMSDGANSITVTGPIVQGALSAPSSEQDIKQKLMKLNDSIYLAHDIKIIKDDNIFMRVSDINDMRRRAVEELNQKRIGQANYVEQDYTIESFHKYDNGIHFNILVRTERQLQILLDKKVNIIIPDANIYKKYASYDNVYYRTNRVSDEEKANQVSVSEVGYLHKQSDGFSEYYLNIANHYTIDALAQYLKVPQLSIELSDNEIQNLMQSYHNRINAEIFLYGRIELMLLKYCPLNLLINKESTCKVCCSNSKYYLVDRNNYEYPLVQEFKNHLTHVLDSKITNKFDLLDKYISYGINYFRIELWDENEQEINKIIERIDKYV